MTGIKDICDLAYDSIVIDYIGVFAGDLRDVNLRGETLLIRAGSGDIVSVSNHVINLLTIGLYRPAWLAEQIQESYPEIWEIYWSDENDNPPFETDIDLASYGEIHTIRPTELLRFWIEVIYHVTEGETASGEDIDQIDRSYRSLLRANHEDLRMGIMPWATKNMDDGIIFLTIPARIRTTKEEPDKNEIKTESAADW